MNQFWVFFALFLIVLAMLFVVVAVIDSELFFHVCRKHGPQTKFWFGSGFYLYFKTKRPPVDNQRNNQL